MSEDHLEVLLANLKTDLGISTDAYNLRLKQYLLFADAFVTEQGAVLDYGSVQDRMLVVQYAAWMWRKRDTGQGMPRMLRYALNNRIFSKKMK